MMVHHGDTGLRSSSICRPSLKFVGLSVRKIWRSSDLNIMSAWWPWSLPLTLKLVRIIAHGVDNLPTNFGVSIQDSSFSTYRPTCVRRITWPCDLDLRTWRSRSLIADTGLSAPFVYQAWTSLAFQFGIYCAFTMWALVGLVTLTFDLWPWIWCTLLPVGWTTLLPILVLLGCFVLDVSAKTCQTHHVILRRWPLTLEVAALVADAGLRAPSVYQVWSS